MDNNFIFESNKNPYEIVNEVSTFALNNITKATEFMVKYLDADRYDVISERTYQISTHNSKIKVSSFQTQLLKGSNICTIEVSNPNSFFGPRFWTHFKGKGDYWTNQLHILECKVDNELLFNVFAQNYEWVYLKVKEIEHMRINGQQISKEFKTLQDIDIISMESEARNVFEKIDYLEQGHDAPQKILEREVTHKVLEKLFKK